MQKPDYLFTPTDAGCYSDGAYGEKHLVEKLCETIGGIQTAQRVGVWTPTPETLFFDRSAGPFLYVVDRIIADLVALISGEEYGGACSCAINDDGSVIYDAVELLNSCGATDPRLCWLLDAGDLLLIAETGSEVL